MNRNKEDLKKLFQEATFSKAPEHLTENIMSAIDKKQKAYAPLISAKVWVVLGVVFAAVFTIVLAAGLSKLTVPEYSVFAIDHLQSLVNNDLYKLISILGISTLSLTFLQTIYRNHKLSV